MDPLTIASLGLGGMQLLQGMSADEYAQKMEKLRLEEEMKQRAANQLQAGGNMFANYLNRMGQGSSAGRLASKDYAKYGRSLGGM